MPQKISLPKAKLTQQTNFSTAISCEIFNDRRCKQGFPEAPNGVCRRQNDHFDASPWWLKVDYTTKKNQIKQA
jgi:hypothetical protein